MFGKKKKAKASQGKAGAKSGKKLASADGGCDEAACQDHGKHWVGVLVLDEDGNPVKDVVLNLELSDGSTQTIDFSKQKLRKDGSYRTKKKLPGGDVEISFENVIDAEWRPK